MESMNDKDPFETFLEGKSFSEKSPESLLLRLEKEAAWNRPWWESGTRIALLTACLVVVLVGVLLFVAQSVPKPAAAPVAEQGPAIEEPVSAPPPVIAKNGDSSLISPFQHKLVEAEPEFNLSFIDRPVNYLEARREYADLI